LRVIAALAGDALSEKSAVAGDTEPVCAEVADAEPDEFEPVTTTSIVLPTSALVSVYVWALAPEMCVHVPPLHCCHW
jgi:hypothetical protein